MEKLKWISSRVDFLAAHCESLHLPSAYEANEAMESRSGEEASLPIQEELCLLPAALLVAERRSNFANRQHGSKLRKCVTNICEAAPAHLKSFARKRATTKTLKFAELTNSPRLTRSGSSRPAEGNVYDLCTLARRSKILYYAS